MISPETAREKAREIAKDSYIHNSGSSLEPNVCRMVRIDLETRIEQAILSTHNEALEEAALIAEKYMTPITGRTTEVGNEISALIRERKVS